jgi:hypothetical protein
VSRIFFQDLPEPNTGTSRHPANLIKTPAFATENRTKFVKSFGIIVKIRKIYLFCVIIKETKRRIS